MKTIYTLLCLLLTGVYSISFSQTATPPSGTGTSGDPYLVASLENLYWITQNSSAWSAVYKQIANIDATASSGWDGGNGFTPIGKESPRFTGTYDGQGYTISNITINRTTPNGIGVFGIVDGATIKNLGVTNVSISAAAYVGGLVGYSYLVTLSNCYSTGTVNGSNTIGGLIGVHGNASGKIDSCYSECAVNNSGSTTGGLAGSTNASIISNSYAIGNVNSSSAVGGLAGSISNSSTISNCYSKGNVTRKSGSTTTTNIGSFVGALSSCTIEYCYSLGSVLVADGSALTGKGFVGQGVTATYTSNFFDSEASNQTSANGATAKTTAEMKTQSTFLNASWSSSTWYMDAAFNSGYPYLSWQNPTGTPLPVELVSFTASAQKNSIELKWKTATEVNNFGFEVERSAAGGVHLAWTKVGFIEGAGTTNAPKAYSFVDASASGVVSYRLKQIDRDGKFKYSQSVEVTIANAPTMFALMQNYPNPFNPTTTIGFTLEKSGMTTLKIYDAIGREVATLVNEYLEAGVMHQRLFSAKGGSASGVDASTLASGVYFARLQSGSQIQLRKIVLLK